MQNQDQAQSDIGLNAITRGAESFLRWSRSAVLRGGRVTKFKGQAASYAPQVGLVTTGAGQGYAAGGAPATLTLSMARRLLRWSTASVALLAATLPAMGPATGPAFAQAQDECVLDGTGGIICQDNGGPATESPDVRAGDLDARVVFQDGFDIDTSATGGDGIVGGELGSISLTQESGSSTITGAVSGIRFTDIYGDIEVITGGDVTGLSSDGIYLRNDDEGGITLDTRAGAVTGSDDGIDVGNGGDGDTVITTGDVDGEGGNGINLEVNAAAGNVVIDTSAGSVTSLNAGIDVDHDGNGDISITTGDVTSENSAGVRVSARGGNIAVDTAAGTVDGVQGGIVVSNSGPTGNISVTAADVVSTSFDTSAIYVSQSGGDVSVDTSAGAVDGARGGVGVRNRGTGDTTITTGAVNGSRNFGVDAFNEANAGDLTIDTTAGAVTGGDNGIDATNNGTGSTFVTTGDVTGDAEYGIVAVNGTSAADIFVDTTAGTVTAGDRGIAVFNNGIGELSVTSGDVNAVLDGIRAINRATGTDLTVDSTAGTLISGDSGIIAINEGTGALSITSATVSGFLGIYAENMGTDLTIDATAGAVTGETNGIDVRNRGNGDTSITTADVTGRDHGIRAINDGSAADLAINTSAGAVLATDSEIGGGIVAVNNGTGNATIVTADVTAEGEGGEGGNGIDVIHAASAGNIDIDSSLGAVTGHIIGIRVSNNGTGDTTITTASVTGETSNGVDVYSAATSGSLTIDTSAGSVTGLNTGIQAGNSGGGDLSITTADVVGTNTDGIEATNGTGTGTFTLDTSAGAVTGGRNGLDLFQQGTGDVAITTGDVTGLAANGVLLRTGYGFVGDIVINTAGGTVTGNNIGITANNVGTGSLTITTADVTGETFAGISAREDGENGVEGADITINTAAGTVTGATDGIFADNIEAGDLSITTADVVGTAEDGIFADNDAGTGSLTIDSSAGAVTGANNGIYASNEGTGDTAITTADVTGTDGVGINVENAASAGSLTVDSTAGTVTSASTGIFARNNGTGALTLTSGDISSGGLGIYAASRGTDIAIDTSAGAVTSEYEGVRGVNRGTGDMTITTGDVTSNDRDGILANNGFEASPGGVNLIIDSSTGTVIGDGDGVIANNFGTGDTSVTTADVTGNGITGIFVTNAATAGNITIDSSAGAVSGAGVGIRALNSGLGDVSITTADVVGTSNAGILVSNAAGAGGVTIDSSAGTVFGGIYGIMAEDVGAGDIIITTADVSADRERGIQADNFGDGNLVIDTSAGTVTGGEVGILARSYGLGTISVTTAAVSGATLDGITVLDEVGGGIAIDTSAGAVMGGNRGIRARALEAGDISIITADVTGVTDNGVEAVTGAGSGSITIDTMAGAVTGGDDGIEARNFGSGTTTITTADVTGGDGTGGSADGISSVSADAVTGVDIDTSAGAVTGDRYGIIATHTGTGVVSITTADVTGLTRTGVEVRDNAFTGGGASVFVDTSAGTVTGGETGIKVDKVFEGYLTITTAGVTGRDGDGIYARSTDADAGDLTIDSSAGLVTGSDNGIVTRNFGVGATIITTADVTGIGGDGIDAQNASSAGDLTIDTSAGIVSGSRYGIRAVNEGTGDTSVTTSDVAGVFGVSVVGRPSSGDLAVNTAQGAVSGVAFGVDATGQGSGDVLVTTADVTSTDDPISTAVSANGMGAFVTVDTTAGSVLGGAAGVSAFSRGEAGETLSITTGNVTTIASYGGAGSAVIASAVNGDVIVDTTTGRLVSFVNGVSGDAQNGSLTITTANVEAATGDGIDANSTGDASDLMIDTSAGAVSGGSNGVAATNEGSGATTITTANVTGTTGDGVRAVTGVDALGLDIDTTAGAVIGGNRGIFADHGGAGDLTITVGNVIGEGAEGIWASSTQVGANIIVTGGEGIASNVIGATTGIAATTQGADIIVSSLDSVTGQAGDALNLVSNGGDIFVRDIGTITGIEGNGIFASSDAGNITIDNVGLIGGITATGGIGIAAYADNGGTITIGTSGDVSGDTYGVEGGADGEAGDITIDTTNYAITGAIGISAVNAGGGDTSVVTADVTGTGGTGIIASTAGVDLLVDTVAGDVSGLIDGIDADNTGTGTTTIIAANVTGVTGDGINATTSFSTIGGIAIDSAAGAISGGQNGIVAANIGVGSTNIVTGDVTGANGDGIAASADVDAGDLTIDSTAGTATGGKSGVTAINDGTGATTIVTADVTGTAGDGIDVTARGSSLVLDTIAGTVTGGETGVDAGNIGTGATTIVVGNVAGLNGAGINFGTGSDAGDIAIDSSAGTVTGATFGVQLSNFGTGSATLTTADVSGATQDGIFINDDGEGGVYGADMTLDTTAGTVSGGLNGINADNSGTGDLSITTTDVSGAANDGILAVNQVGTGNLTINSTAGAVTGGSNGILARNSGSGALSVTAAEVAGAQNTGVDARSYGGSLALSVDTTAGAVTGGASGVVAFNYGNGTLSVMTADVTGTSNDGVLASDAGEGNAIGGGDVFVDTTAGSVIGGDAGIRASNSYSGNLTVIASDVTGNGDGGILAVNNAGSVSIDSVAGRISGQDAGISLSNNGDGSATITSAIVSSTNGDGILASNGQDATDLTIDSSAGVVTSGNRGIFAHNVGTGVLSITTADVTSGNDVGIAALNAGTDLVIDSAAGDVSSTAEGTNAFGIYARNTGSGATSITTANVQGASAAGLDVIASGTDLLVDTVAGDVSGLTDGIDASNLGTGTTTIATGNVTGSDGDGIRAIAEQGTGDLTIDSAFGTITGGANGILADNEGSGETAITTASVTGLAADGVYAIAADGPLVIDTTAGMVMGGDDGIDAETSGLGSLTIASGDVTGAGDAGIEAVSANGALRIDSSAGTVMGNASGIFADQRGTASLDMLVNEVMGATGIVSNATTGDTTITLSSTAVVTGFAGNAIEASSTTGDLTVQGSSGIASGSANGVFVRTSGGDIAAQNIDLVEGLAGNGFDLASNGGDIDIAGIDRVIGVSGSGILADADEGNIQITSAGEITGSLAGIAARTVGGGNVIIDVSGTTFGEAYGIEVASDGGLVLLTNGGNLSGGHFAVFSSGAETGRIDLRNDGILRTAISFANADDELDNRGNFVADGVSDFGDGDDRLFNTGAINVAGTAQFVRLEEFRNAGFVALANGQTGGSLTTSGSFIGDGGTVTLDVDFGSNSSDTLIIEGAASGTTELSVNVLNANATFDGNLVLVNAGVGTRADAFTIADDNVGISPFLSFDLAFDSGTNDFLFGLALEPKAFEATKFGEGAQALWYRSADAWSDHRANARSDGGTHSPIWAVMYGADSDRDNSFTDQTGLGAGTIALDYSQDFYGIQTGLEHQFSDLVTLGITGGYLNSALNLAGSGAAATFDVLNIGASLSFAGDGFFGEVLLKYDDISGDLSDPTVGGFEGAFDGSSVGGLVEFGYRTPNEGFFAEPKVSLEVQRTDLNSVQVLGGRFDFQDFDGLRAGAGVRLGTNSNLGASSRLGVYVDATVLHEFEGDGTTRFTSALDQIAFTNDQVNTYGRFEAGVTLDGDGPVSGFFKAQTDIGSEFNSFGGSAGVRIRF